MTSSNKKVKNNKSLQSYDKILEFFQKIDKTYEISELRIRLELLEKTVFKIIDQLLEDENTKKNDINKYRKRTIKK